MHKTANAAEWVVTNKSASPTTNRAYCGGTFNPSVNQNAFVGFAVNITNLGFNVTTGTFTYTVNLEWARCQYDGDYTRAYAVYGPPSICPVSGYYGLNGTATDCVKYVGSSPAYAPPSDLKCPPSGTNAACVTTAFDAVIRAANDPNWAYSPEKKSYNQTFTIPDWSNYRSNNYSYTKTAQMCQYFKYSTIADGLDNFAHPLNSASPYDSCVDIAVRADWKKLVSAGTLTCTTEAGKNYFTGSGIDKDAQGSAPSIGIYEGGILKQTVVGNVLNTDYNAYLKALGYATNATTPYNIKTELGLLFHDGLVHTVTPKINELTMPNITFGGANTCGGGIVFPILHPWLQTTGGNVVATGKI
ncbi:MAG: hypothetical protein WCN86_01910, partial [bacterium]